MTTIIPRTHSLAIVALVAGIAGWSVMPLIGSVIAILCASAAKRAVERSPAFDDGGGMIRAAFLLGWSAIIASSLAILAMLVLGYATRGG